MQNPLNVKVKKTFFILYSSIQNIEMELVEDCIEMHKLLFELESNNLMYIISKQLVEERGNIVLCDSLLYLQK